MAKWLSCCRTRRNCPSVKVVSSAEVHVRDDHNNEVVFKDQKNLDALRSFVRDLAEFYLDDERDGPVFTAYIANGRLLLTLDQAKDVLDTIDRELKTLSN